MLEEEFLKRAKNGSQVTVITQLMKLLCFHGIATSTAECFL